MYEYCLYNEGARLSLNLFNDMLVNLLNIESLNIETDYKKRRFF